MLATTKTPHSAAKASAPSILTFEERLKQQIAEYTARRVQAEAQANFFAGVVQGKEEALADYLASPVGAKTGKA